MGGEAGFTQLQWLAPVTGRASPSWNEKVNSDGIRDSRKSSQQLGVRALDKGTWPLLYNPILMPYDII